MNGDDPLSPKEPSGRGHVPFDKCGWLILCRSGYSQIFKNSE